MKFSILLSLSFVFSVGCSKPQAAAPGKDSTVATTQQASRTDIQTVMVNVPTARCENCEATITKAVKTVDGVTDVKVNAEKHTAQVQFIAARANKSQIENAIAKAGYNADGVQRDSAAYKNLESCCQ